MTPVDYYTDPHVRQRTLEYCGAVGGSTPTAAYVTSFEPGTLFADWRLERRRPVSEIDTFWRAGLDIARSLWDTDSLVFFIELDYQNSDFPDEPFVRPTDVFFKVEPVYRALRRVLEDFRLPARIQMTGRGYHAVGRVPLDHPVIDELAALAHRPAWYEQVEIRRPPGVTASMTERQARAWTGLGYLVEFVAHLVLGRAAAALPVVVNGTPVGRGSVGRECVSIDFSHVGDPLDVRFIRVAFSTYQLHRLRTDVFSARAAAVPAYATIPRQGRTNLFSILAAGREIERGIDVARRATGLIPDVAAGVANLLTGYQQSPLARFHRQFYVDRAERRPASVVPETIPPCVAAALERPNDLLLKPEYIQHVVRALLARGFSAADIAALVQRRYEAPHDWGDRWQTRMDADTRAEFDVRVFAGLVATGADALIDFNCVSAQEKDMCPGGGCPFDLRDDRAQVRTL